MRQGAAGGGSLDAAGWVIVTRGLKPMSSTIHKRSIHIDAPVEKVFDHVKDPQKQMNAHYQRDSAVTEQAMTSDAGEGSTWRWMGHVWLIYLAGTMTREEYVPNERIVDRSSTGVLQTFTVEPDDSGTRLSLAVEVYSKVPWLDRIEDAIVWDGDRDLDTCLENIKSAIET